MMGTKERAFAPLVAVSLEALVPQDHFYRHLDRTLDLSFVRDLVQATYAALAALPLTRWSSSGCSWSCFSKAFVRSAC